MRAHLAYLKYLLRHKWSVFLACRQLGVPLWRAIVHDWTKFLPSEWAPYVHTFYAPNGRKKQYVETTAFQEAWNHHQKRNKHHWQYWLLTWDRGDSVPIHMPVTCMLEMVADWMGAGRAITGKIETPAWYAKNREAIKLHPLTRARVEEVLDDPWLFARPLSRSGCGCELCAERTNGKPQKSRKQKE